MRYLLAFVMIVAMVSSVFAQPEEETVIRLTIDAAHAPTPALTYQLLPELRDKTSGNAAMLYLRAMAPEWDLQTRLRNKKMERLLDNWLDNPRKVPPKEFDWVLTDSGLKEVDRAARRTYCDWGLIERLRKEGFMMLTPELQHLRLTGRLLEMRARLQILKRHYRLAMDTFQTGFAMARHIGEAPSLIQGLVGISINYGLLQQVEEMIGSPGSPNLYWALTNSPKPFVDIRNGHEGDRISIDALLPGVRDALHQRKPIPQQKAVALARMIADRLHEFALKKRKKGVDYAARVGLAIMAAKVHKEARQILIEQGWSKIAVEKMSITAVWLLYEMHNYDRFYDNYLRWRAVPYLQAQKKLTHERDVLMNAKFADAVPYGMLFASTLIPAVQKVHAAETRLARKIVALRCVEAIRMYLAKHGKFPANLSDIIDVPIPLDPATEKAFIYERKGKGCVLRTHPNPYDFAPENVLRYVLTKRETK